MAFIAVKPCKFAGQRFRIGEEIPADVIQPGAAKNLIKMGVIAERKDEYPTAEPDTITAVKIGEEIRMPDVEIIIHAEEGDMPLNPTTEGLQVIFDVLTSNVSDAEPIIKEMTDGDALILLHLADSRKSIKELAETRAKALNAPQEGEESEGDV